MAMKETGAGYPHVQGEVSEEKEEAVAGSPCSMYPRDAENKCSGPWASGMQQT